MARLAVYQKSSNVFKSFATVATAPATKNSSTAAATTVAVLQNQQKQQQQKQEY
jgi:hypothetical protein